MCSDPLFVNICFDQTCCDYVAVVIHTRIKTAALNASMQMCCEAIHLVAIHDFSDC